MRKTVLTLVLVGLLSLPVLAQFGRGMFGGGAMDATALLGLADVQKALKLSDEQKKSITEATTARGTAFRAAIQDMDQDAMKKAGEDFTKSMTKVKEGLTSEQKKRLGQLEVQAAIQNNQPSIFKREDIQKALKLSDKQIATVKDTLTEIEKDGKELMEEAKGDFSKFKEVMTKMTDMNKEGFSKIAKSLTEEQKKIWTEMQGEKFEGKLTPTFGGKGGKKKKDDF
jgi:hypothetical protein